MRLFYIVTDTDKALGKLDTDESLTAAEGVGARFLKVFGESDVTQHLAIGEASLTDFRSAHQG